jgi:hypothetical protein
MIFLQPIWLAAMAGIALPVIVHFWNDRRGKVLRIGSVVMLEGSSQRMAWSRRVSQWWLLLLRCLLVMVLAVLLSEPYWAWGGAVNKGWVLVDAGAAAVFKDRIDSLVKAGWEKHVLDGAPGKAVNYWNAFRVADRAASGDVPFVVLSSGLASRFMGPRPYTGRVVHWEVYAPGDSVSEWVQRAWPVSPDSVRVMRGEARQTASVYRYTTEVMGRGMTVDTTTLDLTIYTDEGYQQDGRYLGAALRAVQEFTHRRMKVVVSRGGPGAGRGVARDGVLGAGFMPAGRGGWLFWLSSKPLPAAVAGAFGVVWKYEAGSVRKVDTWMEGSGLYKEIEGLDGGDMVWKDGFGRGMLVRDKKTFHFYSRLNPEWGELVWSRQFPALLARLLFGEEGPGAGDRRMMDAAQVVPVRREGKGLRRAVDDLGIAGGKGWGGESLKTGGEADLGGGAIDLGPASWILIFLLFILERWLSGKE